MRVVDCSETHFSERDFLILAKQPGADDSVEDVLPEDSSEDLGDLVGSSDD